MKKISWNGIVDGYYISEYGVVFRKLVSGKYKPLKPKKNRQKRNVVLLKTVENKYRAVLVSSIVMEHFIGGYYKKRKMVHIDGDLNNCSISNLKWARGFEMSIDNSYFKTIDTLNFRLDDKLAVNYMLNGGLDKLYNILELNRGIVYIITKNRWFLRYLDEVKNIAVDKLERWMASGRYKPDGTFKHSVVKLVVNSVNGACSILKRRLIKEGILMSSVEDIIEKSQYDIRDAAGDRKMLVGVFGDGIISNDCNSIEDEISDMFNSLS